MSLFCTWSNDLVPHSPIHLHVCCTFQDAPPDEPVQQIKEWLQHDHTSNVDEFVLHLKEEAAFVPCGELVHSYSRPDNKENGNRSVQFEIYQVMSFPSVHPGVSLSLLSACCHVSHHVLLHAHPTASVCHTCSVSAVFHTLKRYATLLWQSHSIHFLVPGGCGDAWNGRVPQARTDILCVVHRSRFLARAGRSKMAPISSV